MRGLVFGGHVSTLSLPGARPSVMVWSGPGASANSPPLLHAQSATCHSLRDNSRRPHVRNANPTLVIWGVIVTMPATG
ncbi:MAG: hypothetical protein QOF01_4866 [Thermomicrobiales bacterium]|nr:hypothetical protein [Thermomicrobiales bacterium]